MSKMSEIALQLDERAVELGFTDHLEAFGNGYEWGLDKEGNAFLFNPEEEQNKAHEAWLKEKAGVLADLRELLNDYLLTGEQDEIKALERAIDFVESCHD